MKIILLNPSSKHNIAVVRDTLYGCWCKGRANYMWPPLGLAYIGAVLEKSGHEVELIDALATRTPYNQMVEQVNSKKPDMIVLNTATITFGEDLEILQRIKEANPDVKTVFVGTHVTAVPKLVLKEKGVDFIIIGEPDYIVRDLADTLEKGRDVSKVKGLGYIEDGKIKITEPAEVIHNLDGMPFPAWHEIPKEGKYFNPFAKKMPYITALSSRGCPYACIYCSSVILYGNTFRGRSPENVVREIELAKEHGYKEIFYRDETFTFDKERANKICDLILDKGIEMSWMCNSRVDTVTADLLRKMKQAGCHMVKYGVESGSQQILNKLKKGTTIQGIRDAFKWSQDAKLSTVAHFMFGSPGETRETLQATINLAKEIRPDYASFNITTPYPGTELFNQYIKDTGNWSHWDLEKSLESGVFNEQFCEMSREEIEQFFDRAYKEFYFRPGYILKRLRKTNPSEFARIMRASVSFIGFVFKRKSKTYGRNDQGKDSSSNTSIQ